MANIRTVSNHGVDKATAGIVANGDCRPANGRVDGGEIIVGNKEIHYHGCASVSDDVKDRFKATHIADNNTDRIYVTSAHRGKYILH